MARKAGKKKAPKKRKGFDYSALDPYKREAQQAAAQTTEHLARFGFKEVPGTRGESAYLVDIGPAIIAFVVEGLGTKNLVAEDFHHKASIARQLYAGEDTPTHFEGIAQDTVAMIVNDLATSGAAPVVVGQHLSIGSSQWLEDEQARHDFVAGWAAACDLALCAWGPGETATLAGIVYPTTAVLGGASWGIIKPKSRLIRGNVQHGDAIILIEGNGIHANGLTRAREVGEKLDHGYHTPLEGGTYGQALLQPTPIYSLLVEEMLKVGVDVHYVVNVTGHGWRKLMRLDQPFSYEIDRVPEPQPIFGFLQYHLGFTDKEMYADYNMNAGYGLYVSHIHADLAVQVATRAGHTAFVAGRVRKGEKKRVLIRREGKKDIIFGPKDLKIR